MPLGRSAAHKICVSALELAKALISKEALTGFQRGVGFLIRWQFIGVSLWFPCEKISDLIESSARMDYIQEVQCEGYRNCF